MPLGIGWQELLIILLIVLVIFGAGKVPEIGRALGKGIREFKSSVTDSEKGEEQKQEQKAASEKS